MGLLSVEGGGIPSVLTLAVRAPRQSTSIFLRASLKPLLDCGRVITKRRLEGSSRNSESRRRTSFLVLSGKM